MTIKAGPAQQSGGRALTTPWQRRAGAIGVVGAAAAVVLCVLVQAVNGDFFPPAISISQYGVGPHGWLFTLWTVAVAIAVLALYGGRLRPTRGTGYWLLAGAIAIVVMGVVRTDAGGAQQSFHAKVHMAASVITLVALPVGMAMAMRGARSWVVRAAWTMLAFSAVALAGVLASAFGMAGPGMTAERSWALWQAISVTLDMMLLAAFAFATLDTADEPRISRRI